MCYNYVPHNNVVFDGIGGQKNDVIMAHDCKEHILFSGFEPDRIRLIRLETVDHRKTADFILAKPQNESAMRLAHDLLE